MTKRFVPLILILALLLPGCTQPSGQEQASTPVDLTAEQVLDLMMTAVSDTSGVLVTSGETLTDELEAFYGLSQGQWKDAVIARMGGAQAFELTVILLAEDAAASAISAAQDGLKNYLLNRQGDFTGYAPDQAELAANGLVLSAGRWLALVISEDAEAVKVAFERCFTEDSVAVGAPDLQPLDTLPDGRTPYIDPNIDDMTLYDTSAILAAWDSGDRAALSEKDAAILSAAEAVLNEVTTSSMSDYDKELAVYTWMSSAVDYDWNHNDPRLQMDPDSPNPYGGLVNHKAICLGFATTFQLLMDMADVECITVVGAAFSSREDHAWNMVRLDGEWYCVDATWDMDMADFDIPFTYFNVTSDWMADTDHQWDYSSVPEATAIGDGKS